MRGITSLVAICLARCAGSARDFPKDPSNLVRPDSPLDDLSHKVQNAAARAKAVAADARSSAAEAAGRVSSEQTVVSQYTAEHIANTIPHEKPYLAATVREASAQNVNAKAAAAATQGGYNTAILKQKEEVANAAAWASQATEKALADPMMKLQEWKMEVLHDPMSEAKLAAEKAARPYRQAVAKLHQRISEYTKRAAQLNSQAFGLQVASKGLAGAAVGMQKGGTPAAYASASSMMKSAQHMLMQAAVFNAQAKKLEMMAGKMNLSFQAYQAGGEAAAQVAAHWYAPTLVAPAPNGGAIWAPPGPPIPFSLAQTKATSELAVGSFDASFDLASSEASKTASEVASKTPSQSAVKAGPVRRKEGNPFVRRRLPV